MKKLDQARDQAQRELWDVINRMSLRRQTTVGDLRAWAESLERVRKRLAEVARAEEVEEEKLTSSE
jgi:hypothetical protein